MKKLLILYLMLNLFGFGADGQNPPMISFGAIADIQYCNCDAAGSRYYNLSLQKLEEAVTTFNDIETEFVITMGDLIDRDFSSFNPVLDILGQSGLRLYNIPGNHDFSVDRKYRKKVLDKLSAGTGYRSFISKGFRFIMLNSCEISTYSPKSAYRSTAEKMIKKLREEDKPYAFDWNGGMSEEQISWLRDELELAECSNEKVLIFSHHTVMPEGNHNIYNRDQLLDLLSGYTNVIAWFSGHNHAGDYGNFNNIHFVTLKGLVDTPDSNSYSLIELYHNKIWIKGFGREKSQILAY